MYKTFCPMKRCHITAFSTDFFRSFEQLHDLHNSFSATTNANEQRNQWAQFILNKLPHNVYIQIWSTISNHTAHLALLSTLRPSNNSRWLKHTPPLSLHRKRPAGLQYG